jgi:hypothetical protein
MRDPGVFRTTRILLACALALAAAGVLSMRERQRSVTAGPLILRDPETRLAIRTTGEVELSAADAASLRLVATKHRYRLDVLRGDEILKTYPIALGGQPEGRKEREGDGRTPEGDYLLIPHHPSPGFGRCFYLCYPNEQDAADGLRAGRIDAAQRRRIVRSLQPAGSKLPRRPPHDTPLGGLILLHATKEPSPAPLTTANWTNGCIALEQEHLDELLGIWGPDDRPRLAILP